MDDTRPARQRVFETNELLTMILLEVNVKDLLVNCQRISKSASQLIEGSKAMQRKLFFLAEDDDPEMPERIVKHGKEEDWLVQHIDRIRHNPFFFEQDWYEEQEDEHGVERVFKEFIDRFAIDEFAKAEDARKSRAKLITPSYERMLVTQPPRDDVALEYYLDTCDLEPYDHYTCGIMRKNQQVITMGDVIFIVGLEHMFHDVEKRIGVRFGEKLERVERYLDAEEDADDFGGETRGTAFVSMIQWSTRKDGVEETESEKDHDWCDFLRGHGEWDEEDEEASDWSEWEKEELLQNPHRHIENVAADRDRHEWLEKMLLERGLQKYDTQTPMSNAGL